MQAASHRLPARSGGSIPQRRRPETDVAGGRAKGEPMIEKLERWFGLSERGSDVRTELTAG